MDFKTIYVVYFLEKENDVVIEHGVHERVFYTKEEAQRVMDEMADGKLNELLEDYTDEDAYIVRYSHGEMCVVISPIGTYEYSIAICND